MNRNVEKGLARLFRSNLGQFVRLSGLYKTCFDASNQKIGLQSVLQPESSIIIDRTIFKDVFDVKSSTFKESETLSSRSETNSTKTNASSTDNSQKSKQSNVDLAAMSTAPYEDLTQRYYRELKNSLSSK